MMLAAVLAGLGSPGETARAAGGAPPPIPKAHCGPGSHPETGLQGRVSIDDIQSGRALEGYRCNTVVVGKEVSPIPFGSFGGFKVLRYFDTAGHECAFYDAQSLVGTGLGNVSGGLNAGVAVLDMSDPAHPVRTATLSSVAMLTPHESLVVSQKRGLLVAVAGTPALGPGVVDVYDVSKDCRHPLLKSLPNLAAIVGHESGLSPDGKTFYSGNPGNGGLAAAVDISNPSAPETIVSLPMASHGITISDDGNTAYMTSLDPTGVRIVDVSEIQSREPNPQVREIGFVGWTGSIPQIAHRVTVGGHPYLVEIDEFSALGYSSGGDTFPGVGRIIDIADPTKPTVVSDIRLEVHQPEHFEELSNDPGSALPVGGYSGHYCNVPRTADPNIVACSMGSSGLRVIDIRNPKAPKELAYFNQPNLTLAPPGGTLSAPPPPSAPAAFNPISFSMQPPSWALSSPTFAPERCEIWYSDGRTGFWNVRLTNGVCALMAVDDTEPTPAPKSTPRPITSDDPDDASSDNDGDDDGENSDDDSDSGSDGGARGSGEDGDGDLADAGSSVPLWSLLVALGLALGGAHLAALSRLRTRKS